MSNEGRTETEAPDEEEAPPETSAEAGEGRDPSEEKEDVTATVPDMPAAKVAAEMRKRAEEEGDAADEDGESEDEGEEEEELPPEDEGPEGPISFRYFGLTDVGLVREHNEDNFTVVDLATEEAWWGGEGEDANSPKEIIEGELGPQGLVFAVCDGMGGAAAGEVASKMAVETIREVMLAGDPPQERDGFAHRLVYAIEEAGARIFSAAKMDRSRRGMGTTATVAGLVDRVLFIGQVGDSRCYVLRDGELSLVTKDQSLVNQLIEAGQLTEEEAEAFEHSNIILQALGTTEEVAVDLTFLELRQGDRLMLCSDGLSGLVHGEMIQEMMAEGDDLQAIAMKLVEMANAGGGHDNITCVVAEVGGEGLAAAEGAPAAIYQQYPLPPADGYDSEIPPREPTMKTATRKPGADVKRDPMQLEAGRADVPTKGFPFGMMLVALVLLGLVLAVVFGLDDEEPERPAPPPPTVEPEPEPEPVEVCVRTDVPESELVVDGQTISHFPESGAAICLPVQPGVHRFEAHSGGNSVVRASITVREGHPADVNLELPEGTFETPTEEDAGPGAEPEPEVEPEPEPTMETVTRVRPRMRERPTMTATETTETTETMAATATMMSAPMTSTPMETAPTMEATETADTEMAPPDNPFGP